MEEILPLEHRHGADDSGMEVELAKRTHFDFVADPLVDRGKPPDETASDSWDHVRGRRFFVDRYVHLYDRFLARPAHRGATDRLPRGARATGGVGVGPAGHAGAGAGGARDAGRRSLVRGRCPPSVAGRPGVEFADRLGVAP